MTNDHTELLARLDRFAFSPFENTATLCIEARAAIRELTEQLEAERKAREEAEATIRSYDMYVLVPIDRHNALEALEQRAEAVEAKLAAVGAETIERCAKVLCTFCAHAPHLQLKEIDGEYFHIELDGAKMFCSASKLRVLKESAASSGVQTNEATHS